jgi:sporulation and spore germination protein
MTPRWRYWFLGALVLAVVIAAIYLPILRRNIRQAAKLQQRSEEQARRELSQPTVINPSDPKVKAKLFWASGADDGTLSAVNVELPLSSDPVLRAKQVLNTLLAGPVDIELRTVPPDAALLAFYLLPDGTAIADFSEALATSIPSGIESEQMAVDSITKTLEANVPRVRRLKILIHGQEMETLAGHLDLSQSFFVNANVGPGPRATATPKPGATTLALTPTAATVKLAAPETKP